MNGALIPALYVSIFTERREAKTEDALLVNLPTASILGVKVRQEKGSLGRTCSLLPASECTRSDWRPGRPVPPGSGGSKGKRASGHEEADPRRFDPDGRKGSRG